MSLRVQGRDAAKRQAARAALASDAYRIDSVKRRLAALATEPWAGYEAARRSLPRPEDTRP